MKITPLTPTDEEQKVMHKAMIHHERKEYDKAFLLYKQVAKGNYTELSFFAAMRLGKMYLDGKGTTKDEAQAFYWYSKAAETGNEQAQCVLAAMYYNGVGVTEDYQKALVWFRKAAEQGYSDAQCGLGKMYLYGKGVKATHYESIQWFRKAAEQGDADAMYHIGLIYHEEKNKDEAMVWFRKAAKKGNADAKRYLRENGLFKVFYDVIEEVKYSLK